MSLTTKIIGKISIDSDKSAGSTAGTSYTTTGSRYILATQTVGTSYEAIAFNDLTSCKVVYIENQSTSSVHLSMTNDATKIFSTLSPVDSGSNFILLPASASAASGVYAVSVQNGANVEVGAFEV